MAAVDETPCPMCGESTVATDRVCRSCGERLVEPEETAEAAADRRALESEESDMALKLLLTGLIGCLSPMYAPYGLYFLARYRNPYPRKWMAVVGTVIHWLWIASMVLGIVAATD
jgi:hypothetical protein